MVDISNIFLIKYEPKPQWISLCGRLEAIVGKYFLSQAGNPYAHWYGIYFDELLNDGECVEKVNKNLKGYVSYDNRVAFVINDFIETFKGDTKDFGIFYIGVDSLETECLQCKSYSKNENRILPAIWLDDDFLNDENIQFDYDAFELIDDGVKYLNPKHFSVENLIKYCRFEEE